MAVPKRKKSKSRTMSRRSTWKTETPANSLCPQCHSPKLPHRACRECGYYEGREVIKVQ